MKSIKAWSLEGNSQKLDGGAMFGNAPRIMWERWIKPDELGRIPLACRSLLIEWNGKKILFETGVGAFFEPKLAERFGVQNAGELLLIRNLAELKISPDHIDYVVLSHLHFDHAGGLLPKYSDLESDTGLNFKNAKYVIGKEAWERAQAPHSRDRASFVPELITRLKQSERVIIVESSSLPEHFGETIEFFISNGHTPGQLLSKIKGPKETMIFLGDLVPGTHWVHLPITMGYDRFPEMLIDEKRELYESIDPGKTVFFYTHDPEISASHVKANEKGKWQAVDKLEHVNELEF